MYHCASAAALLASASEHKSPALVSSTLLSSQHLTRFQCVFDYMYDMSRSSIPSFSTAKTMCSMLFLPQVWFLSFIIIFLIYLGMFSGIFGYIINLIAMCPCFQSPKQCVAYLSGYGYDFIYFILVYQHIFNVSFGYTTHLVAVPPHFQPK